MHAYGCGCLHVDGHVCIFFYGYVIYVYGCACMDV